MPYDHLHAPGPRAYDALAPFYDRYWGPAFLGDAVHLFRRFLASRLSASSRILDLCCGTGDFAAWLEGAGLQVTGVDASRTMIDYARAKAPCSNFHVADMRTFRLSSSFCAAVCFYNSINQVLTENALRSTLRSVAEHVEPGGWFLFDVVLEEAYERAWHGYETVACDNQMCELTYQYDEQEQIAACLVTVGDSAVDAGAGPFEFFQRPHPLPLLVRKLHGSGFDLVEVARATCTGHERVAILARRATDLKPAGPASSSNLSTSLTGE